MPVFQARSSNCRNRRGLFLCGHLVKRFRFFHSANLIPIRFEPHYFQYFLYHLYNFEWH